jgi:hypothetical protein
MKPFIETIRDVESNQETLRRRPYGIIEAAQGKLVKIQLKPWPKIASLMEAHWIQRMKTRRYQYDVCRLFYNQPMGHRNYLTLAYVESSFKTSLKTFYVTLDTLNQIAYLKRSDAILAEVTNSRLTDRFMIRRGWERYMEHKSQRNLPASRIQCPPLEVRIRFSLAAMALDSTDPEIKIEQNSEFG